MTSRSRPCPKLRVTKRAVTPRRPQNAQMCNELLDIDCDEDRATRWPELCDDRRRGTAERATADDVFCSLVWRSLCCSTISPVRTTLSRSKMLRPSSSISSAA